ncbi:hypothetical protein SAMN05421664_2113 [Chryseobacterium soldanellicola]|uniref:Uncharacterized protein n=1 Tax=Chryseobacterium soldanellicola TaxID=311333 RepID=A0A1H1CTF2_9FLAO|nr:hypothetical protein [Chryseobacterium soldanellicola]SDQ67483.1 hypothetical protein SAMN05421664_2113 [Chryseobacterium soldanellicola]
MKKQILSILLLTTTTILIKSQVGINNLTPQATLDITAKNGAEPDGLLVPRIDRLRAQNMAGVQNSTLIFVNNVSNGTQTGQAANIDITGYYYYDTATTAWVKLNPVAAPPASVNIYNADGTLTGNRVVTQNANTLTFNATSTNAFSVDGNTFSVDAANNRIGMGTAAPAGKLDVIMDNLGGGAGNDMYFTGFGSSAYPAFFLGSARGTVAAPANLSSGDIVGAYYFNPRFNNTSSYTNAGMVSVYKGDGTTALSDLTLRASGADRVHINEIGNVGIGTLSPNAKLEVNSGTANTSGIRMTNLTSASPTSTGQILGVDASGNVITLAPAAAPASVNIYNADGTLTGNRVVTQNGNTLAFNATSTNAFSVDGSTFSVDAVNDRIGIGTTAPMAKLDMVGTTFGMKNSSGSGSWDNLWFNVGPSVPSINASGADSGLQFNVGANAVGTYGDGQTLTTVATMLPNGNMGIGTTTPAAKLHTVSSTPYAAFQMQDGSQGTNKVLVSDANGGATWQKNTGNIPVVFAAISATGYTGTNTGVQDLGTNITLPPGKWIVNTNVLLKCQTALNVSQAIWVKLTWSATAGGSASGDIAGGPFASGALTGPSDYGMATGNIVINNTSGANKTYYLSQNNHINYGTTCSFDKLGSSA